MILHRLNRCNARASQVAAAGLVALIAPGTAVADCRFWETAIGQPGMNSDVLALVEYEGDLIAGGHFISAGGQVVHRIARWEASTNAWHPLSAPGDGGGGGGLDDRVRALAVYDGDLIAAGDFNFAMNGTLLNKIARWDQAAEQWQPLGIGVDSRVLALIEFEGDLIVGGRFTLAGGVQVNNIARWDGKQWHAMASGLDDDVHALAVFGGQLVAGGRFEEAVNGDGQPLNHIARWDAKLEMWQPLAPGAGLDDEVHALAELNGELVAAGFFDDALFVIEGRKAVEVNVNHIARWDGEQWHALDEGLDDRVFALAVFNNRLIAGGRFEFAGGVEVNHVAAWSGTGWSPLGTSKGGVDDRVHALLGFDGALIVGGEFREFGSPAISGAQANRIARWIELEPAAPADLNCDGVVGVADLLILLAHWGPCPDPGDCPSDLTGDGSVGVADLLALLASWG